MFCKHDWQAYGKGYIASDPDFSVKYHDLVCLKCGKEDNQAMKKRVEDLAQVESAFKIAELACKKRRARRLKELGKEPAN